MRESLECRSGGSTAGGLRRPSSCRSGSRSGCRYYGTPFFYDYYHREFGWSRPEITLGLPLGALLTLWVGPVLVHRFSPRTMILIGSTSTFLAFLGFGVMGGSLAFYYFLWILYKAGAIFAGPIPYQVLISQWFRKRRGLAMGIAYTGVGVIGGISSKLVTQPLTEAFGFQTALIGLGLLMFLTWPVALWVMKDRPADVGSTRTAPPPPSSRTGAMARPRDRCRSRRCCGTRAFWLLLIGSCTSIGAIGSINQHMKLVFLDYFQAAGITGAGAQLALNDMFSTTLMYIMFASVIGRIGMGYLADRFPKKWVMVVTYSLVAGAIPLLLHAAPPHTPYVFAIVFGLGLGADYMLVPLMAADLFGVKSLARSMAIIQPIDSFGQTMFPYLIAHLRQYLGNYADALRRCSASRWSARSPSCCYPTRAATQSRQTAAHAGPRFSSCSFALGYSRSRPARRRAEGDTMSFPALLHSISYSGSWGQVTLPLDRFIDKAADLGYDGVMLMAKRPHLSLLDYGERERARLRDQLERRNLKHVCVAGYNNLTGDWEHAEVPRREIWVHYLSELARLTRDLGGDLLRIFTAYEHPAATFAAQWGDVIGTIKELSRRAAEYGVTIGVQNHHDIGTGWESQYELVQSIGEPNCKALFDAWAPALHGADLTLAARTLAPITAHTTTANYRRLPRYRYEHGGVVNYSAQVPHMQAVPIDEGVIDYTAFLGALRDGGFTGGVAYELCSPLRDGGSIETSIATLAASSSSSGAFARRLPVRPWTVPRRIAIPQGE